MRIAETADFYYYPELRLASSVEGLGAFIKVPDVVEKWIGDSAEAEVVKEAGGLLGNKEATAYVNRIGQKIVAVSRRPRFGYKFDLVKDESPNAFALPNGSVYVTVGLAKLLRNEAQLANVLGHEVAHITERHTSNQIQVNLGAAFIGAVIAGVAGAKESKAAQDLVFGLISSGYSRENERESDEKGQKYASRAGWDPGGMVDVMEIFKALEKEEPKGIEKYLRSHPYAKERLKSAKERTPALPPGERNERAYQDFLAILEEQEKPTPTVVPEKQPPMKFPEPKEVAAVTETPEWIPIVVGGVVVLLLAFLFLRKE